MKRGISIWSYRLHVTVSEGVNEEGAGEHIFGTAGYMLLTCITEWEQGWDHISGASDFVICFYYSSESAKEEGGGEHVFGAADYMNPTDCRQYLYCLTPNPSMYTDSKMLKGVTNIGKLDIVWKTNFGEKGRLQTSALQRVVASYIDFQIFISL